MIYNAYFSKKKLIYLPWFPIDKMIVFHVGIIIPEIMLNITKYLLHFDLMPQIKIILHNSHSSHILSGIQRIKVKNNYFSINFPYSLHYSTGRFEKLSSTEYIECLLVHACIMISAIVCRLFFIVLPWLSTQGVSNVRWWVHVFEILLVQMFVACCYERKLI